MAELLCQFYNNPWECQLFLALDQVRVGLRSSYDEGKRSAETLFFDYHRQNHVNIRVVRIFNTYGPRMHPNDGRVVSNFIVQVLLGQDITVFRAGDPEFLLRG